LVGLPGPLASLCGEYRSTCRGGARVQPRNLPLHGKAVAWIALNLILMPGSSQCLGTGAVAKQRHQVIGVPVDLLLAFQVMVILKSDVLVDESEASARLRSLRLLCSEHRASETSLRVPRRHLIGSQQQCRAAAVAPFAILRNGSVGGSPSISLSRLPASADATCYTWSRT
jgi:hypothetical protein